MSDQASPTIAVESVGCKLNQAEAQQLERRLEAAGYRLVAPEDGPDIYILNTCTVTHVADRKSRHLLRLARRRNPAARLVATGCYAESAPHDLAKIEGVELIQGNDLKEGLVEMLGGLGQEHRPAAGRGAAPVPPRPGGRTRTFIKVQEGCAGACAYCIVPLVRGREKNVPAAAVVSGVGEMAAGGCREVALTGTEIGRYADAGTDLRGLIERILAETAIERLRISSLQPREISAGLLALWRDPRLCPHFHLSLQSGSGAVLRAMKRRYTTADFMEAVDLIRQTVPEAAVTTDVIVGFPGETDAGFRQTLDFCRRAGFARVHVFPYSARRGTAAASFEGQVPEAVKRSRAREALALAKVLAREFRGRFLGRTLDVLWEKESGGVWSGLTGNYIRVYAKAPDDLANRILPAVLERPYRDGVWGRLA